jgi:TRAP-type C4-dicarboxylate transport system permease small subunit
MTMEEPRTRIRVRRVVGALILAFGLFALFGGLFVPLDVILRDPQMVPAPESWVAAWIMLIGALVLVWPSRRKGEGA